MSASNLGRKQPSTITRRRAMALGGTFLGADSQPQSPAATGETQPKLQTRTAKQAPRATFFSDIDDSATSSLDDLRQAYRDPVIHSAKRGGLLLRFFRSR